ncbi:cell polarity protein alp11 [Stagonosporopsis vannaccii]|nr:cell polarity protein alp11 [Stagonosporopsis vannaccii]
MSLQSAADVPLLISSPNSSSERRISPSWTIAHLKSRLEPITGVPASSQQLSLRVGSQDAVSITAPDEEQTRLAQFPLQPYAEITVVDTRPPAARTDFSDLSAVEKYVMPTAEYESRTDSVLAWKKSQKLGRFDPDAPSIEQQKVLASEREIEERVAYGYACMPLSTLAATLETGYRTMSQYSISQSKTAMRDFLWRKGDPEAVF